MVMGGKNKKKLFFITRKWIKLSSNILIINLNSFQSLDKRTGCV